MSLSTIEEALAALREGKPVLVADDEVPDLAEGDKTVAYGLHWTTLRPGTVNHMRYKQVLMSA